MRTGYVYAPVFLEHNLPSHPENATRLQQVLGTLQEHALLPHLRQLESLSATVEQVGRVHSPGMIGRVQRLAQTGGGYLDPDTYVTPRSFEAALAAAGAVIDLTSAVLAGEVDNGFALVRPPGHHATPTRSMGFCLFNNVALATKAALVSGRARRVLVVDFDVHHGNGTQDAFAAAPEVFYASTHQYPHYPGTGHWSEVGSGRGEGSVLDVSLPRGVGDKGYAQVFSELLWPIAQRFGPDLLLVSAGYDAHWSDPLAQMNLSLSGYAWLQRELVNMAGDLCDGRIAFALEGGYQPEVLGLGVLNGFHAMMGTGRTVDPLGPSPFAERPVRALVEELKHLHGLD